MRMRYEKFPSNQTAEECEKTNEKKKKQNGNKNQMRCEKCSAHLWTRRLIVRRWDFGQSSTRER